MTAKTRELKNNTKVTQVFYDSRLNPITLRPGETFVEDLSGVIDIATLLNKEKERRALEADVEETRRVKRVLALIKATKKVEDLAKFKEGETNQDLLDALLLKEKELLNGDK